MEETKSRRKILMSSYYYPPKGGISALRTYKFSKYLQNFGYEPIIFTTTEEYQSGPTPPGYESEDELDIEIHRFEPAHSIITNNIPNNLSGTIYGKKFNELIWALTSAYKIYEYTRTTDVDFIYYTGGPYVQLYFCALTKSITDIPYIVDLRDPWTINTYNTTSENDSWIQLLMRDLKIKFDSSIELPVLSKASAVIVPTKTMYDNYLQSYPSLQETLHVINNGFDIDDFPTNTSKEYPTYTIVYPGRFGRRDPQPFLTALNNVSNEYDMKFIHIGEEEEKLKKTVHQTGVEEEVCFYGYTNRNEVAELVNGANLGVVITGGKEFEMTTKVFDYIACNTPILAVGPKTGDLCSLVSEFENGYISTNNEDDIESELRKIVNEKPSKLDENNKTKVKYSRESLTSELAQVLDNIRNK